jgi:hypothetical protein
MGVTRFFKCTPEQSEGFNSTLMPDGDTLALDVFKNSKEVYRDETMVICHVILDDITLTMITEMTEVGDPLSIEAVKALGIQGSYAGKDRTEVLVNFPELVGQKKVGVDEDGKDIMVNKLMNHRWLGE